MENIQYRGQWLTMTRQATLTLHKSDFPGGIYVIVLLHENDDACVMSKGQTNGRNASLHDRSKEISLTVTNPIDTSAVDYWINRTIVYFVTLSLFSFLLP